MIWKTLPTSENSTESLKNQEKSKDVFAVLLNTKWWIVTAVVPFIMLSIVAVIYMTKRKQRIIKIKRLSDYQAVQHLADYDRLQTDIALPVRVEFREEIRHPSVIDHYNVVIEDKYFSSEMLSNLPSQDELRDLEIIDRQIVQTLHGTELSRENEEYLQILPSDDDYLKPDSSKSEVQIIDSEDYLQMQPEDKKYLSDGDSECSLDLK